MNIESIFSWMLLIIPIAAIFNSVQHDSGWTGTFKRLVIFGGGVAIFWCFRGIVEAITTNAVTYILDTSVDKSLVAVYISAFILMAIFGCIWYLLTSLVIKPKNTFEKIVVFGITIIGGTAAAVIYYKSINSLTDYTPIMVTEFGFLLAATIVAYWKSKLQNYLAVPSALVLAVLVTLYYQYCKTGINIIQLYDADPQSLGPWVICLSIMTAHSTVFDKKTDWDKRWSYKLLNIYLICVLILSLNLGVNNFYGSNGIERKNKSRMNTLQVKLLNKNLEKIELSTFSELVNINIKANSEKGEETKNEELRKIISHSREFDYDEMTNEKADSIQADAKSSAEKLQSVMYYRMYVNEMVEEAVANVPKPKELYNKRALAKNYPSILNPFGWFGWWGKKDKDKEKEKEEKEIEEEVIYYQKGFYAISSLRGEPTSNHWIQRHDNAEFFIRWNREKYGKSFLMKTKSGLVFTPSMIETGQVHTYEPIKIIPINQSDVHVSLEVK